MLRPGDVVADAWRVVDRLGEGGMGTVWRAVDVRSGAPVALKTISAGASWDPDMIGRFEREAVLAAKVDAGGGVARVHALRRLDRGVVMVQELVEGQDLGRLLRAGAVDRARLVRLVAAVARTLARIHAAGVVHRDVKPSNIIVRASDDGPVLVDFGLAWSAEVSRLTGSGAVLGTLSYMAPEQANYASTAHAPSVDVHALGAVLYEGLTGRPPRTGGGLGALAELAAGVPPPSPRSLDPSIDPALEALALEALAFDPATRPSAMALAEALERWSPAAATRSRSRRRLVLCAGALALVLVVLGARAGRDAWRSSAAREALTAHARWEETTVAATLAGELPPAAEVDARVAALDDAAAALEGDDLERARVHAERAAALRARWALVRAGRLERERVARGGSESLLAWAARLAPDDPRRLDGVAEVTSAWHDVVRDRVGRSESLKTLKKVAPAVDARAHAAALEATDDLWAARLGAAFRLGTESTVVKELGDALGLIDGATVGPRLAAALDHPCTRVQETIRTLRATQFLEQATLTALGLRLARYAEALRGLPGGRVGAAVVGGLAEYLHATQSEEPAQAEILLMAVRVGASLGYYVDACSLGKRADGEAVLVALRARARRGDGAAHFLLATVLLPGRFGETPAKPTEVLEHLSAALKSPGDLSPRHLAEAQAIEGCLRAKLLHLAGAPDDVAEALRLLEGAREAAAPWPFIHHLVLSELSKVLERAGRREDMLALWLEQRDRLRAAPVAKHTDVALGQTYALLLSLHADAGRTTEADQVQREVEARGSGDVRYGFISSPVMVNRTERARAAVDTAPPAAWHSDDFCEAVVELAPSVDRDAVLVWLERAQAALGSSPAGARFLEALRRAATARDGGR